MITPRLTSQPTHISSDVKDNDNAISIAMLAYFRTRLSNRIHELVLSEFAAQERNGKTSRAKLANKIRRKPEQITRWLGSPGNWTIETLSDLLLGMGLEPALALRTVNSHEESSRVEYEHISSLTTLFRSHIDVQTPKEVARDIANGNHKSMYYSVKLPINERSLSLTTQLPPLPSPPLGTFYTTEEYVHVAK